MRRFDHLRPYKLFVHPVGPVRARLVSQESRHGVQLFEHQADGPAFSPVFVARAARGVQDLSQQTTETSFKYMRQASWLLAQ